MTDATSDLSLFLHKKLVSRAQNPCHNVDVIDLSDVSSRYLQECERHCQVRQNMVTMAPRNLSLTPMYEVVVEDEPMDIDIANLEQRFRDALTELDVLLQPVQPMNLYAVKRQQQKIAALLTAVNHLDEKLTATQLASVQRRKLGDVKSVDGSLDTAVSYYLKNYYDKSVPQRRIRRRKKYEESLSEETTHDMMESSVVQADPNDRFGISLPIIDNRLTATVERSRKIRKQPQTTKSLLRQAQRVHELRTLIGDQQNSLAKVNINGEILPGSLDFSNRTATQAFSRTTVTCNSRRVRPVTSSTERSSPTYPEPPTESILPADSVTTSEAGDSFDDIALEDIDTSIASEVSLPWDNIYTDSAKSTRAQSEIGTENSRRLRKAHSVHLSSAYKVSTEGTNGEDLEKEPEYSTVLQKYSKVSKTRDSLRESSLGTTQLPITDALNQRAEETDSDWIPLSLRRSATDPEMTPDKLIRGNAARLLSRQSSRVSHVKGQSTEPKSRVPTGIINKSIRPFSEHSVQHDSKDSMVGSNHADTMGNDGVLPTEPLDVESESAKSAGEVSDKSRDCTALIEEGLLPESPSRTSASSRHSQSTSRSSSTDYMSFNHECSCPESLENAKIFTSCKGCFKTFRHEEWCRLAQAPRRLPRCRNCKGIITSLVIISRVPSRLEPDRLSESSEESVVNAEERRAEALQELDDLASEVPIPADNQTPTALLHIDLSDEADREMIPTIRLQRASRAADETWKDEPFARHTPSFSTRSQSPITALPRALTSRQSSNSISLQLNEKSPIGPNEALEDNQPADLTDDPVRGANSQPGQAEGQVVEPDTNGGSSVVKKSIPQPGSDWTEVHKNAYIAALAVARSKNLPLRSEYLASNISRSFTYTYFGSAPWSERGHSRSSQQKSRTSGETAQGLKQVLGSTNIYDYYPGGAKNALKKLPTVGKP